MISKVENLKPGQEVVPMNCANPGRVIRRLEKNLYLVSWNGHEIPMRRSALAVRVGNRWMFGPHNAR